MEAHLTTPFRLPPFAARAKDYDHPSHEAGAQLPARMPTDARLASAPAQRGWILRQVHAEEASGHMEIAEKYNIIRPRFHWTGAYTDVAKYYNSYQMCKMSQPHPETITEQVRAKAPFQAGGFDILEPIREAASGKKHILIQTI